MTLTAKQLACHPDWRGPRTQQGVTKARREGRISREPDGKYDLERCNREYAENTDTAQSRLEKGVAERKSGNLVDAKTFQEWRTRTEKAKAEKLEFEFKVRQKEFLPAADVKRAARATGAMHAAAREAVPLQLAPLLVGKIDVGEIESIIRKALSDCDARVADEMNQRYGDVVETEPDERGTLAV